MVSYMGRSGRMKKNEDNKYIENIEDDKDYKKN